MKVAIEGCCHGELDKIYETIGYLENTNDIKVDLLLICGDFQSVRNTSDLQTMAAPAKYRLMNTFYKYYSGEKKAPLLTVFIGGNHEASNYLQELPYGGWVAPNIFYMGYANVIQFGGIRIGGLSGIYKPRDYERGHFERPPYNEETKRSAYHIRNVDVFRLKQLSRPVDIMMSHDWPRGVYHHGNTERLLRAKRHFREEVETNTLGSKPAQELLHHIKPDYWFSAHLHVKFAAAIQHQMDDGSTKTTKFLSLDKCLPKRQFLQVIDVPHDPANDLSLSLDPEWLVILKSTNHLLNIKPHKRFMPGLGSAERWDFRVTDDEIKSIKSDFDDNLAIPDNFSATADVYSPGSSRNAAPSPLVTRTNPQTTLLCTMIELTDPNAEFLGRDSSFTLDTSSFCESLENDEGPRSDDDEISANSSINTTCESSFNASFNPDEIAIDDDDDDDDDEDLVTGEITSESDVLPTTASSADEKDSEPPSVGSEDAESVKRDDKINVEDELDKIIVEDDDAELNDILAAQKCKSVAGVKDVDSRQSVCERIVSSLSDKTTGVSESSSQKESASRGSGERDGTTGERDGTTGERDGTTGEFAWDTTVNRVVTSMDNAGERGNGNRVRDNTVDDLSDVNKNSASQSTSQESVENVGKQESLENIAKSMGEKLASTPILDDSVTTDVSPKRGLDDTPVVAGKVKKMKRRNMCMYSSEDTEGEG